MRLDKGIGVYGDEQIGLGAARLVDPFKKGNEVIAIAREKGAHILLLVDQRLDAAGNGQGNVLFVRAVRPFGAGIFATMPGVDGHGNQTDVVRFDHGIGKFRCLGRFGIGNLAICGLDLHPIPTGRFAGRVGRRPDLRVHRRRGGAVEINNQTLAVLTHRLQFKNLGTNFGF